MPEQANHKWTALYQSAGSVVSAELAAPSERYARIKAVVEGKKMGLKLLDLGKSSSRSFLEREPLADQDDIDHVLSILGERWRDFNLVPGTPDIKGGKKCLELYP